MVQEITSVTDKKYCNDSWKCVYQEWTCEV